MDDLNYFLEEENKYNASHKDIDIMWYDEENGEMNLGFDDSLDFLIKKPFEKYSKASAAHINETSKYNLSPIERTILSMFFGDCSAEFRDDLYYGDIPELVKKMMDILDDVVKKAPTTEHNFLYRVCNDYDDVKNSVGDVIHVKHNLTCSAENWNAKNANVYVIRTLPPNKTRAHDLYKIYNKAKEYQVNFLRNTCFKVTELIPNGNYGEMMFYLDEMPMTK